MLIALVCNNLMILIFFLNDDIHPLHILNALSSDLRGTQTHAETRKPVITDLFRQTKRIANSDILCKPFIL